MLVLPREDANMMKSRIIGEHFLNFEHNAWNFGNIRPSFRPVKNDVSEEIHAEQLDYAKEVYKNIFFQAFRLKKDIFKPLKVAELKCLNNLIEKPEYERAGVVTKNPMNHLEKGMVCVKILADEIGCTVAEFIVPTEEMRRNEVYHWLCNMDSMLKETIQIHEYVSEEPYDEEVKSFKRYSFNEWIMTGNHWTDVYTVDVNMDFFIDKIIYRNEEIWYVMKAAFLYYGLREEDLPYEYTYEGAEIYAEQQGYLASWFENVYKEYKESTWPKDFYRYGQE